MELDGVPDDELRPALRRMAGERAATFAVLSCVLAGAYLLVPEIRRGIGYPGQAARTAPFDQAAGEIMDGVLDPVLERGPIHRAVPRQAAADAT
ncbi:hypothetical protein FSW04_00235 [Baekduia soli]|uniref:Uncharacterized protein n=1 Tax=Baekduia soli TaxID=496014 RepID=A0A5B8TZJ4_9ACTN|nr:hypothetical protein [Baekduia soli]QEC46145.1 hypothetical protein FSW04_00235 [Baekduia soli]